MKTYLTYGAAMAFASAVFTLILHILGFWTNPEKLGTAFIIAMVGGLAITTVVVILGTRAARGPATGAGFSYGQALKAGFLIVVASAIFGAVFSYIYFGFINPNFAETSAQWTQSFMERMGAPESQIEKRVEEIRTTSTVGKQVVNGLIGAIITGGIISLITSAFLRRAPSEDLTGAPAV